MAKYYSFLLIASMWLITVLCVNSATVASDTGTKDGDVMDDIIGNITLLFQGLSKIPQSSNIFAKLLEDTGERYIAFLDSNKREIKYAVDKGTEMEKQIQNISQKLKKSTVPLTKALQLELDEIGKSVTTELMKIKEMSSVKYIEEVEKQAKVDFAKTQGKLESVFTLPLPESSDDKKTNTINKSTASVIATKIYDFVKTVVPVVATEIKDEGKISNKVKITYTTLSKIRNSLVRVEEIQNDLLQLRKEHYGTDAASLICSSLTKCFFAVLLGILF